MTSSELWSTSPSRPPTPNRKSFRAVVSHHGTCTGGAVWPAWAGTGTAEASLFRYESSDPNYAIDLAVSETGAVECPGCGEQRKQLVPHLRKDKSCMRKCEEINLESFDKQLKAFRQRKSVKTFKSKQKEEDKEGFLENQRKQQQKTKQKRRLIPFISHSTHHCVVLFKI